MSKPVRTSPDDRNRTVAIVTDSAAALPSDLIERHELLVARMEITINGKTYSDGPTGELDDF